MTYYVEDSSRRHDVEPLTYGDRSAEAFLTDPSTEGGRSATALERDGALVLFLYRADDEAEPRVCLLVDDLASGESGDVEVVAGGLPREGTWMPRHDDDTRVADRRPSVPRESSLSEEPFYQTISLEWGSDRGNGVYFDGELSDAFEVAVEVLDATGIDSAFVASGDPESPTYEALSMDGELRIGSDDPDVVSANVTTLSYIPGEKENSTEGGDPLASGFPHFFPREPYEVTTPGPLDIDVDLYDFLQLTPAGRVVAELSVHPILDSWFTGDMIPIEEGLPDLLGGPSFEQTALGKRAGKYEEVDPSIRLNEFRFQNKLSVTFETTGESIDEDSIRFHHRATATDTVMEQEDLNPLPRDWFEFTDDVEGTSSRLQSPRKQPQYNYETVTVDGVEGVRTVAVAASETQFAEAVTEQVEQNFIHAASVLFDWPTAVQDLSGLLDPITEEFRPVIDMLAVKPNIYTCYELVALADGRKAVRLWDHSPYPHHQLYLGTGDGRPQKRFESELRVEHFEPINEYVLLFFAVTAAGLSPFEARDDYRDQLVESIPEQLLVEAVSDIVDSSPFGVVHSGLPDADDVVELATQDNPVLTFGVDGSDDALDTSSARAIFDALDDPLLDPFDRELLFRHDESWEAGELEGVFLRHGEDWEAGAPPTLERQHVEHWAAGSLGDLVLRHSEAWTAGDLDGVSLQHSERWEAAGLDGIDLQHVEHWDSAESVAPSPPRNLEATAEGPTNVDLAWDPPADGQSDVESYVVAVDGADAQTVAGSETTATIDDLEQGRTYTVGVRTVDAEENESDPATIDVATGGDPYSIRFEPIQETVYENGYVESDVVLEAAPAGLNSASLTVAVVDESVATVDDATPGPALDGSSSVSIDGAATATLVASDLDVDQGSTDVELLTVRLATHEAGDLAVGIEDSAGTTASGETITTTTAGIDLSVEPVLAESEFEPRDLNGDGLYRDVNGDGSVSNGDITDFFSRQHVSPWDDRPEFFDFTGDGDVSQSDVIALFEHVNS